MRVRCRGACGLKLLIGQKLLHLFGKGFPFLRRQVFECIRYRAPAHVAGENGFLGLARVAILGFQ